MTLFVPTIYAMSDGTEWHALVDVTAEHGGDRLHHLIIRRRTNERLRRMRARYGPEAALELLAAGGAPARYGMPWRLSRVETCSVAADSVRQTGRECCWRETPAAVRHLVMQYLGLAQ